MTRERPHRGRSPRRHIALPRRRASSLEPLHTYGVHCVCCVLRQLFHGRATPPRVEVASTGWRKQTEGKKPSIIYSYKIILGQETVFSFEGRYSALRTK